MLIIVGGKPASGKTTIAQLLSCELGIGWVSQDGIKEARFDTLGWSDVAWSQSLGAASTEVLYHVVERFLAAGDSLIAESNYEPLRAAPRFRELQRRFPTRTIQVLCVADGSVLLERYQERIASGVRHPGHVDHQRVEEKRDHLLHQHAAALDLEVSVIEVDTADFSPVNCGALIAAVRAAMEMMEVADHK